MGLTSIFGASQPGVTINAAVLSAIIAGVVSIVVTLLGNWVQRNKEKALLKINVKFEHLNELNQATNDFMEKMRVYQRELNTCFSDVNDHEKMMNTSLKISYFQYINRTPELQKIITNVSYEQIKLSDMAIYYSKSYKVFLKFNNHFDRFRFLLRQYTHSKEVYMEKQEHGASNVNELTSELDKLIDEIMDFKNTVAKEMV